MPKNSYTDLLRAPPTPSLTAAELHHPYQFLTERHLQALWLEQKYFHNLKTIDGHSIQVLSPGIWNSEAGPDFLKATLLIDGKELRGDIELHLYEENWYQHSHHLDPRYDQVILHVAFWNDSAKNPLITSKQKVLHRAHLKNYLTISEDLIVKVIDLDLYPYQRFVGSGRCAQSLFKTLSEVKISNLLRSAAIWRLEQKRVFLEQNSDLDAANFFKAGIAMALGYKNNAEAFLTLFKLLKKERNNDEQQLFIQALGCCGFFEEYYRKKWSQSTLYQTLYSYFTTHLTDHALQRVHLRLDHIRPANHPIRRLAFLAKILSDPNMETLPSKLLQCWKKGWATAKGKDYKKIKDEMIALLPSYFDPYWESHYTFEQNSQKKSIALVGDDLKKEIFINVCLPWLHGKLEENSTIDEKRTFREFFSYLPATSNRKSTYLSHRFFGDSSAKQLLHNADMQQGAYQLHRDFCIHYEASCIGCPFVERYKENDHDQKLAVIRTNSCSC